MKILFYWQSPKKLYEFKTCAIILASACTKQVIFNESSESRFDKCNTNQFITGDVLYIVCKSNKAPVYVFLQNAWY